MRCSTSSPASFAAPSSRAGRATLRRTALQGAKTRGSCLVALEKNGLAAPSKRQLSALRTCRGTHSGQQRAMHYGKRSQRPPSTQPLPRILTCCSGPLLGLPKRGKNAKIRAGAEFIRRISAMSIFSIRTAVLAVAVSASSLSSAAALSAQSELLCSPEGLMRLIPQFNVNGKFTIPNPNTDLQTFLSAQQGLSNAIDMILAQENISQNPSDVGSLPSRPLIFASNWLSSEVGIQTDGTKLNSPEQGGKFGGHRVQSFLTGLTPVPLSQGSIYVIKQSNPTYQALVYPMPTSHPCVNRLVLAADNTVGSWPTPTYALGRYQLDNNGLPMRDKPLATYLIVNICLDLGKSGIINKQSVLRPNAMIILAFHWPCEGPGCGNNGTGHQH
jgi:hypothetical protein